MTQPLAGPLAASVQGSPEDPAVARNPAPSALQRAAGARPGGAPSSPPAAPDTPPKQHHTSVP